MNKTYSKIWNASRGCLVVASELASSHGRPVVRCALALLLTAALAAPQAGIAAGQAQAATQPSSIGATVTPGAAADQYFDANGSDDADASGDDAVAAGASSAAAGIDSVAVGHASAAFGDGSTAVGAYSGAFSTGSSEIGRAHV